MLGDIVRTYEGSEEFEIEQELRGSRRTQSVSQQRGAQTTSRDTKRAGRFVYRSCSECCNASGKVQSYTESPRTNGETQTNSAGAGCPSFCSFCRPVCKPAAHSRPYLIECLTRRLFGRSPTPSQPSSSSSIDSPPPPLPLLPPPASPPSLVTLASSPPSLPSLPSSLPMSSLSDKATSAVATCPHLRLRPSTDDALLTGVDDVAPAPFNGVVVPVVDSPRSLAIPLAFLPFRSRAPPLLTRPRCCRA